MDTKKPLPSRTLTFKIGENDYSVDYPNTGALLELQKQKHILSSGQYTQFAAGVTNADQTAQLTIDMIAFFVVCCPQVQKDLTIKTFSSLPPLEAKKLLMVYVKQIMPWFVEWEIVLNADDEAVEGESENKE